MLPCHIYNVFLKGGPLGRGTVQRSDGDHVTANPRETPHINECPKMGCEPISIRCSVHALYNPLLSIALLFSIDMFQVASHPTSFAAHPHAHHHARPIPTPTVQLPRTLARPPFLEVSREAIIAVAPELANVPAEYIRRGLRPKTYQYVTPASLNSFRVSLTRLRRMLAGIAALSIPTSMSKSQLPPSLSIPIRPTSSQPSYPTHVLAVGSSRSSPNEHVMMFPIHNIVLASHCSLLPRLPKSPPPSSSKLHAPVLPLTLPSPAAFKVIHTYLYNHSLGGVLQALFPLPSGFVQSLSHNTVQSTLASGSTLHQLSSYLCSSAGSSLQILTTHAAHVKELWQDMVALGLFDPELWDTVDLAWEVVLGALNLAASGH